MRTFFSAFNGALVLTEEAGVCTLSFDEELGGGEAKGIVSGKGSMVFDGEKGLQLGEKLLNAHLPPAMQPLALVVEGIGLQALKALE